MNKKEMETVINILHNLKSEVKHLAEYTIAKGGKYNMKCIDNDLELLEDLVRNDKVNKYKGVITI